MSEAIRTERAPGTAEFLLEIGCEEIPAPWLADLAEQMAVAFTEGASREHLAPRGVRTLWAPRRLVLRADVLARQEDREEQVWGPSLKIAKDAAGNWTKAAEGFARKNNVSVDELQVVGRGSSGIVGDMPPGSQPLDFYLLYPRKVVGVSSAQVLPPVIAQTLRSLAFPKRMSWDAWLEDGRGAFPFGRPIRWIVALLGGEVVPFEVFGLEDGGRGERIVRSGNETRGHRFLPVEKAGQPIRVESFDDLRRKLRERFVVLDPDERATLIEKGLADLAGGAARGHDLLAEWRDLVEYPTVVGGKIPSEFRALPLEVLQTVLVHHQKYIPLVSLGTVESFAAITNTDGSQSADIVRGMERVVVARLRDAAFFFEEDRKRPLASRVEDLAGVTFHEGLGNYRDKGERMVRLVDAMGTRMGLLTKAEHEAVLQAARLAKADLTTLMVREFPELQGIMGGIYLRAEGQVWDTVATAVQWHYHPISIEEGSPPAQALVGSDATVFAAVSLADKLDTLAGYFAINEAPTGSRDPYALRRAALGAIRLLLDFWQGETDEQRPNLSRLVTAALDGYEEQRLIRLDTAERRSVEGGLHLFLLERLEHILETRGFPPDEVAAAVNPEDDEDTNLVSDPGPHRIQALQDAYDCLVRLRALNRVRAEATGDFENLAVAFKRARNILRQQITSPDVRPDLFQSDSERELCDAIGRLKRSNSRGYEARLRELATLREPMDRFFDDVLVMAEDLDVRSNRLGLLRQALSLFYRIADISKLGG